MCEGHATLERHGRGSSSGGHYNRSTSGASRGQVQANERTQSLAALTPEFKPLKRGPPEAPSCAVCPVLQIVLSGLLCVVQQH